MPTHVGLPRASTTVSGAASGASTHFRGRGDEVVVLTRSPGGELPVREVRWDGRTVGPWAAELEDAVVVNLAGELVDRRPTRRGVDLLSRSRVEPTRALVQAAAGLDAPVPLWLQMSTLAIYGDAGEPVLDESAPPADGPPQMAGVARAWEEAVDGANAQRLAVLRTGIVLDRDTPAFQRLTTLTRFGLGGRIGSGRQWVSWLHVDDFARAVMWVRTSDLDGVVHVTAPEPVRNADMMASLRTALGRPWAPPAPAPLVRIGAMLLRTDPALALTGRCCHPTRLLDAGFRFRYRTFDAALAELL